MPWFFIIWASVATVLVLLFGFSIAVFVYYCLKYNIIYYKYHEILITIYYNCNQDFVGLCADMLFFFLRKTDRVIY
jgi:hypothetical protein